LPTSAKPAIDNLAKAINLDAKDGSGWDVLNGYANEPTAAEPWPQQKGILCAPATPPSMQRPSKRSARRPERTHPSGLSDQWRRRRARRRATELAR